MKPKEVFPGIFQLKIPLPNNPLNHLNAYLLHMEDKNFLVDVGVDAPESFEELKHQLAWLGLKPKDLTGILITHAHTDHIGLVSKIKKTSSVKVFIHEKEIETLKWYSLNMRTFKLKLVELYKKKEN